MFGGPDTLTYSSNTESDSYQYDDSSNENYYDHLDSGPPQGPLPVGPLVKMVPIPINEDPHHGYTFREYLVNNGIPYDGRDYVTRHRNDLILDGYFDQDSCSSDDYDDHSCPKKWGMGSCDHPNHRVQVTCGIPDRVTGERHPPSNKVQNKKAYNSRSRSRQCHCAKSKLMSKANLDAKSRPQVINPIAPFIPLPRKQRKH